MTTTSERTFTSIETLPARPEPDDLLAFFGVPPDPSSALEDNIRAKRRYWHKRSNVNNPNGRERARRVKELIEQASAALLRGLEATGGGTEPEEQPDLHDVNTIDDLWQAIQELVFGGQVEEALRLAETSIRRWAEAPEPHAALAWIVATAASERTIQSEQVLRRGLAAVDEALRVDPSDAVSYESKVTILSVLGEHEAVLRTVEVASVQGQLTARLAVYRVVAWLRGGRIDDGLHAAVHLIADDPEEAVRAELAEAIVYYAAQPQLPISSKEQQRWFAEIVACAAWCAQGVPDAENLVRPYRLWAARSGERIFAGSWGLRSLLAVASGFLFLPIHNQVKGRPIWRTFLEGPEKGHQDFYMVTSSSFVRQVHQGVALPWVQSDGRWPELPVSGQQT